MSNEVTTTGNLPIDPFQEYADEVASRAHINGQLLRFTKHGEWKAGQDQDEIAEGTRLLAYMPGLKRGWVKWAEGAPVRHIIGLVSERYIPPKREELGDLDESDWPELNGRAIDPWQKTNYLSMIDEQGEMYTFVTSSKGGLSAIGEVSDVYAKRRRMKPEEIPVIELHARSYNHKDYGETFAPVLKVISWAAIPENFSELDAAMGETEEQAQLTFETPKPAPVVAKLKPVAKPVAKAPVKAVGKKNGPRKTIKF